MYSNPDSPRIRPQGTLQVLGLHDIIQEGDLARCIRYGASHSDYTDYSAVRDMDWRRVSRTDTKHGALCAWVGKRLIDLYTSNGGSTTNPQWPIEIVRELPGSNP